MGTLDSAASAKLATSALEQVESLRKMMVDVSTGGARIQEAEDDYARMRTKLGKDLERLGLDDPNPHRGLWDWYERWSSGDLPSYRSRRQYLREMFAPLEDQLRQVAAGQAVRKPPEPTGWPAVDRVIGKMRADLSAAKEPEDFQQVGLLAREMLISLAQAVYDPAAHPNTDGVQPSKTDAHRMLGAFIAAELGGSDNEPLRKHAKAALDLAVALQHKRTADFRMAALALEAATSVVNTIAIVSGRRDPTAA
jgi:hypothetical protein